MSRGRRLGLLGLGGAALVVLACLAPWAHDRIRCEMLLRRLEKGDAAAAAELAERRFVRRLLERHTETGAEPLLWPLLTVLERGELEGAERRELFDRAFPARFTEQAESPAAAWSFLDGERFVGRTSKTVWEFVAAGPWQAASHRLSVPDGGGVQAYMEWFVLGKGDAARCLHQRCTWVSYPPGAKTLAERFHTETEDLTDVPDPLNLYLGPLRRLSLPDGEPAIELNLAAMGTWRQFIPRRRLLERSAAYSIHLDRSGEDPPRERLHIADVAVSAETALCRWFARDALRGTPIADLDRGAHRIAILVPAAAARLEPFRKLRLHFEPAPAYARSLGFEAPAANCAPFARDYYLPPPLAGQ